MTIQTKKNKLKKETMQSDVLFQKSIAVAEMQLHWNTLKRLQKAAKYGTCHRDDDGGPCVYWGDAHTVSTSNYPFDVETLSSITDATVIAGSCSPPEVTVTPVIRLISEDWSGATCVGYYDSPDNWSWEITSCGGHMVGAANQQGAIWFTADGKPSEMSWADNNSAREDSDHGRSLERRRELKSMFNIESIND